MCLTDAPRSPPRTNLSSAGLKNWDCIYIVAVRDEESKESKEGQAPQAPSPPVTRLREKEQQEASPSARRLREKEQQEANPSTGRLQEGEEEERPLVRGSTEFFASPFGVEELTRAKAPSDATAPPGDAHVHNQGRFFRALSVHHEEDEEEEEDEQQRQVPSLPAPVVVPTFFSVVALLSHLLDFTQEVYSSPPEPVREASLLLAPFFFQSFSDRASTTSSLRAFAWRAAKAASLWSPSRAGVCRLAASEGGSQPCGFPCPPT